MSESRFGRRFDEDIASRTDAFNNWLAAIENRLRNEEGAVETTASIGIDRESVETGSYDTTNEINEALNAEKNIEVVGMEFYILNNAKNHMTQKYETVNTQNIPVLRRARTFYLGIISKGQRPIDPAKDSLTLSFEFGSTPSVPKGTKVVLPISSSKTSLHPNAIQWDAIVYNKAGGRDLILEVQIGCAAAVGAWKCKVTTLSGPSPYDAVGTKSVYSYHHPIYILFNPYSRHDTVYMPIECQLKEYIQNDVGKIWIGTYKEYNGRPWSYGQFEDSVLPACCFILERSGLKPSDRGNPVKVARTISALVNSVDDDGILVGRWSAPYSDGVAPYEWCGSVPIIEAYMQNEGKRPVKYGQCWVFSAVTVTICRALGLPTRSVTNFVSAHDTNNSLTIDKFFDADGEEVQENNMDSVWNFHVWNDVWMARHDLPKGYGGWQAIDSTPQEASENIYQCGPAPLEAIKFGEIGIGYDTSFIFAEVNADVCHFVKDDQSPWGFSRTNIDKYHVGRLILTKSPVLGIYDKDSDLEDITNQYKNREGSKNERMSVFNAVRGVDRAMTYYDYPTRDMEDVRIKLEDLDRVRYGDAYKAKVFLENKSKHPRTLDAVVTSSSIYYNGVRAHLIKKSEGQFVLQPGQKETLAMTVYPDEYMNQLVDYCMVKFHSLVHIKETGQMWSDEDDFVMEKPKLKIQIPIRITKEKLERLEVSFKNPLEVTLTNCLIGLECPGVFRSMKEKVDDVMPGACFTHKVYVKARKVGQGTIVALFSSDQLSDVNGTSVIEVGNSG